MSLAYCGSCHKYPEPELLDKNSWKEYMLPRMGYLLGIYPNDSVRSSLIEEGTGGVKVEQANIFPKQPLIDEGTWKLIQQYYLQSAPEQLPPPPEKNIVKGLKHFKVKTSPFRLSPPSTTLVRFSGSTFYIGDAHTQTFYHFDAQMGLLKAAKVREGAVWLEEADDALVVTVMGSFSPTDSPSGLVLALPKNPSYKPKVIIPNLQRPVHAELEDLNLDGKVDVVICEFGKWTGSLSWWENQGNNYKRNTLRNKAGAIKAYPVDLNKDGLPDIVALFGQGDEGIFAYYNLGNGKFKEERLLQFDASWGSSYFNLFDFEDDGDLDIIYCAGDNADFKPIMKHYHGIRIYINDGQQHFHEEFFYQLNGAYNAIPLDFDLDGDTDIAAISFFPDFQTSPEESFVYLENTGNMQFEASTFPEVNDGRWVVMDSGDMDQDGDQDLILGSLAFEVVPKSNYVQQWIEKGIPYIILENTTR